MNRLEEIRRQERISHTEIYSEYELFEPGSWLEKPVKSVIDILPLFENYAGLDVLDLGSGVGRNAIPIAIRFKDKECHIDCVDILYISIDKLRKNAIKYGVEKAISGIISSLEQYTIAPNKYDFILAISVLEHIDTRDNLLRKLCEIRKGLKKNGVICLIMNSNIKERDLNTGSELLPQFECNLSNKELENMTDSVFSNFKILKKTLKRQDFVIPRGDKKIKMNTDVFTLIARKS